MDIMWITLRKAFDPAYQTLMQLSYFTDTYDFVIGLSPIARQFVDKPLKNEQEA